MARSAPVRELFPERARKPVRLGAQASLRTRAARDPGAAAAVVLKESVRGAVRAERAGPEPEWCAAEDAVERSRRWPTGAAVGPAWRALVLQPGLLLMRRLPARQGSFPETVRGLLWTERAERRQRVERWPALERTLQRRAALRRPLALPRPRADTALVHRPERGCESVPRRRRRPNSSASSSR